MSENLSYLKRLPVFGTLRADVVNGEGFAMINELSMNDGNIGESVFILEQWIDDIYNVKLSLLSKKFFKGKQYDLSLINEKEIESFKIRMKEEFFIDVDEDFDEFLYQIRDQHSDDIDAAENARKNGKLN